MHYAGPTGQNREAALSVVQPVALLAHSADPPEIKQHHFSDLLLSPSQWLGAVVYTQFPGPCAPDEDSGQAIRTLTEGALRA